MKDKVKRTERGWAGHFICAENCQFRRNTLLEYGKKKWIISTVGRYLTTDYTTKKLKFDAIGAGNRYYETMAFVGVEDADGYIDANTSEPIDYESDWAIHDIMEKIQL